MKENAILLLTEPPQRPKECSLIFDVKAMPNCERDKRF